METAECMVESIDVNRRRNGERNVSSRSKNIVPCRRSCSSSLGIYSQNAPFRKPRVLDAIVTRAGQGELILRPMEPPPPDRCSWFLLPAGNTTTTTAMMQSVRRLAKEKSNCCGLFSKLAPGVVSDPASLSDVQSQLLSTASSDSRVNASQTIPKEYTKISPWYGVRLVQGRPLLSSASSSNGNNLSKRSNTSLSPPQQPTLSLTSSKNS